MTDPADLSITKVRAMMLAGELGPGDLVRASLRRIRERDPELRAWLCLDPTAEARADAMDPDDRRPLAGIPVGVKDVFDTEGLPTTHNSPLYQGHRPSTDAAAVTILRNAGAVIIGKTDTTEFAAAGHDAATANPHDPARTPGGSSAGSAAAVADRHVSLALATQTGGSTIRPASFCGILGFKPSFGAISTEGMKRYAPSFDNVGFHLRDPRDLEIVARVFDLGEISTPQRPRLGLCLTPYRAKILPEMNRALALAADRLRQVADLVPFDLPGDMADLDDLHRRVMFAEGATSFLPLAHHPDLHPDFHERIAARHATRRIAYEARDRLAAHAARTETLMAEAELHALLAPAAPGPAPEGRGPGNPILNALWTAMQLPCLALPIPVLGLPLGAQIVAPRGADGLLVGIAQRIAPALREASHIHA